LRQQPLFGGLGDDGLAVFAEAASKTELAPGEVLYFEGDRADHLYVIESGELLVIKGDGDNESELAVLGEGDFFGEMSFVDMQPRSATVRARSGSTLWGWPYRALRDAYQHDTKAYTLLVMNIARELSRRLRRADEVIVYGR
jgi:CRP-like cAMP-binding protein